MEKLFVPYELAILARDKSVKLEIYFAWMMGDGSSKEPKYEALVKLQWYQVGLPLYDQLLDWFEEKYIYIHTYTECIGSDEWVYAYVIKHLPIDKQGLKKRSTSFEYIESFKEGYGTYTGGWDTRQQALSEAFKQAFKLIP